MKNVKAAVNEKKIPVIVIKPHKFDPLENYERDLSFAPSVPPLHPLWQYDLGKREQIVPEILIEEKREMTSELSEEIEIVQHKPSIDGPTLSDWDQRLALNGYGKDVTLMPGASQERQLADEKEKQKKRSKRRISHILGSFDHSDQSQRRQKSAADFSERSASSEVTSGIIVKSEPDRRPSRLKRDHSSSHDVTFAKEETDETVVQRETSPSPASDLPSSQSQRKMSISINLKSSTQHHRVHILAPPEGPRDTAQELMRRMTVDSVKSQELWRYYQEKWVRTPTGSSPWINDQLEKFRRLSAESRNIHLPSKFYIPDDILDGFCYRNSDKTKDLVLRGKEVQDIVGRRIADYDLPHIFDYLNQHPNIATLDLCYNNITNAGFDVIAAFLSWNETLKSINLMNNDITRISGTAINSLCANKKLKSFRVNGNAIGPKGGQYLSFLIMFKKIEHLDIGQTNQTLASLAWIGQAVANAPKLKILDASRLLGYPNYVSDSLNFSIAFGDILRFSNTLVELHLQKNNINDYDLEHLLWGLRFNKTLELLDLSCNCIADDGAEKLADSLNFGGPLKALMLSSNHIADRGARALSFELPFSQIKLLDITKNRIRDQGILDIVHTLRKPTPLLALFMFGNHFKEETLKALEIKINTGIISVKSLDVHVYWSSNQIGHGHNPTADRYKAKYYGVPSACRAELFGRKRNSLPPCFPGCLFYKFHNVVNAIKPEKTQLKLEIYPGDGPTCST